MSTILEALKKSEEERQVTKVPTLADMPAPHEAQRWPHVLLFIILGLLLVLIGLAVKLVLFPTDKQGVVESLSVAESVSAPAVNQQGGVDGQDAQVDAPVVQPAINNNVIEVNVVSYSEQPEKRFVMIGGKLFRENEFVRAGLKVEEIRQNEVVLNQRGEQIIRRP